MKNKEKFGVVYIMYAPVTGLIKISSCVNVVNALSCACAESGMTNIELFYVSPPVADYCGLCEKAQEHYKENSIIGCWFKLSASVVSVYITEVATKYMVADIYKMFVEGKTMSEIETQHNITHQAIYAKLKGWNIKDKDATIKTVASDNKKERATKNIVADTTSKDNATIKTVADTTSKDNATIKTVADTTSKDNATIKTVAEVKPATIKKVDTIKADPQPVVISGDISREALALKVKATAERIAKEKAAKDAEKAAKEARMKGLKPEQANIDFPE